MTARCACWRTGARERVTSFPDLPTFKELGYTDVEFYIWAGLFTPQGRAGADHDALRCAMR